MWEKMKEKMKNAKNSRAVYITVVTLLLALAVLITATAIANRAKKNSGGSDQNPPVSDGAGTGNEDSGNTNTPSTGDGSNSGSNGGNDNTNQTPDNGNGGNSGNGDSSTVKPGDQPEETPTASVPELSLPVNGSVYKGHDTSIQVFSPTTGDYRIHLGVDMVTEENAPVVAPADGVVSRIWDDALMGKCLAVSHSGDCYTIYKNLSNDLPKDIVVGATVVAGQQLGTVGDTATLELAEEPHLHMEMTVKGLAVDPMDYFSQQALEALGKDNSHEAGVNDPKQ